MTTPDSSPAADGAALFTRVAAGRVAQRIVAQVRGLIVDGQLSPGDRLPSERELAERFRVSRVTVRDALRVLEAQGLLAIRVGASGGAFVTAPSAGVVGEGISSMLRLSALSAEDVAEARLVMELGTVALAVQRATPEDVHVLREICRRATEAFADDRYDVVLSAEWHAALAGIAHNGAIRMITESFSGPLSMTAIRAREPALRSHGQTVAEHTAITEAIAARDADAARRAMVDHLVRGTAMGRAAAELVAAGRPV